MMGLCFVGTKDTLADADDSYEMQQGSSLDSDYTNLVVFVRFADEDEFVDREYNGSTVRKITDNTYNGNMYSVRDYYNNVSDGMFDFDTVYLYDKNGSVKLSKPRAYYARYSEDNPDGFKDNSERSRRMYELKQDWSAAVNAVIEAGGSITDYTGNTIYDFAELDKNNDGMIDSLTIIYKNTEQNNISVQRSDPLWNYKDYAPYIEISNNGKTIQSRDYLQLTNKYDFLYTNPSGDIFLPFGTAAHEMGHMLGLKDLYNSSNNSPVYFMSVMAKHMTEVPQFISIKEKEALGWTTPEGLVTIKTSGEYKLRAMGTNGGASAYGYKLDLPELNKTLYLEYRNFGVDGNIYDTSYKNILNKNGDKIKGKDLKSGLVCYLADKDTRFPNNMGCTASNWNYKVLGGTQDTKSDAAVGAGEELKITDDLMVKVIDISDNVLRFNIEGVSYTEPEEHNHTGGTATCIHRPVCSICHQEYGYVDVNNHVNTEIKNSKLPTTTDYGYTGDEYCIDCGKLIKAGDLIAKLPPTIIEGNDMKVNAGKNESVSFRSNAAFDDFLCVKIDGNELVKDTDYTALEGSIIIKLSSQLLNMLSEGNHTIDIVSVGGTASTNFYVKKEINEDINLPGSGTSSGSTSEGSLTTGGAATPTTQAGEMESDNTDESLDGTISTTEAATATGDENFAWIYIILMVTCICIAGGIFTSSRKKNSKYT